jgi:hypothetical protein
MLRFVLRLILDPLVFAKSFFGFAWTAFVGTAIVLAVILILANVVGMLGMVR